MDGLRNFPPLPPPFAEVQEAPFSGQMNGQGGDDPVRPGAVGEGGVKKPNAIFLDQCPAGAFCPG
jgi:hypothetical protein